MWRTHLTTYWDFIRDRWLRALPHRDWRVYWQIIMLLHDYSDDGRATFTWHILSSLVGLRNKNITMFRILRRLHDGEKIIWEDYNEFAERIPEELRDRLGIDPEVGVSERGTIPKWKMSKGGVIWDKVTLFSPQVAEMYKAYRSRFYRRIYIPGGDLTRCPYYSVCQFMWSIRGNDSCPDGSNLGGKRDSVLRNARGQ